MTVNVPGDYPTIQAALDAASGGETIVVAPGTYHEHLRFGGQAVVLESAAGPAATIIDGSSTGRVILMTPTEYQQPSTLRGFTIENGLAEPPFAPGGPGGGPWGPGIYVEGPAIVEGNVITHNSGCGGDGVYAVGTAVAEQTVIADNVVTANSQDSRQDCRAIGGDQGDMGGGILILGNAVVSGNTISANTSALGGGIASIGNGLGRPLIEDNTITNNTASEGGGVGLFGFSQGRLVQNVITENQAAGAGGGIALENEAAATVVNNTVVGNASSDGEALWVGQHSPQLFTLNSVEVWNNIFESTSQAVDCRQGSDTYLAHNDAVPDAGGVAYGGSCSWANSSLGNVSQGPRFVSSSDLHLLPGSPAIDSGSSSAPELPPDDLDGHPRVEGSAIDLGAYESPGSVHALSPSLLDFGPQDLDQTSQERKVTVRNLASTSITIGAVDIVGPSGPEGFAITEDSCPGAVLPSQQACAIGVAFGPLSGGEAIAQLSIGVSSSSTPWHVQLRGASAPVVSPASLDFGTVAVGSTSSSKALVMTNTGPAFSTLYSFGLGPGLVNDDSPGQGCARLAPRDTCTDLVSFAPIAAGPDPGKVFWEFRAGSAVAPRYVQLVVPVTGTGVATAAGPPTSLEWVAGGGQVTLSWAPPANDGGSAIVAYAIYLYGADGSSSMAETQAVGLTETGLQAGVYYTFTVTAYNGVGWSPWANWAVWSQVT